MRFYVYALTDPRDGSRFYIGKGVGSRKDAHEREARAGRDAGNPRKADRIREIIAAGTRPLAEVIEHFDTEAEAYAFEARLIRETPNLLNIMAGGGGGYALTHDEAARRARERANTPEKISAAYKATLTRYVANWRFVERVRHLPMWGMFIRVFEGFIEERGHTEPIRQLIADLKARETNHGTA